MHEAEITIAQRYKIELWLLRLEENRICREYGFSKSAAGSRLPQSYFQEKQEQKNGKSDA